MPQVRLRIPKRRSVLAARRCADDPPPRRGLALLSRLPEYGLELVARSGRRGGGPTYPTYPQRPRSAAFAIYKRVRCCN